MIGGSMLDQASADTQSGKTFLGHPRGLIILFLTEMWERFSYYGMRGLLILYLTEHFLFSDNRSTLIYGAYTSLVYIMAVIGGSLADQYLGARKAVTFGAILLVFGHVGMTFEGSGTKQFMTYQGQEYQLAASGRGSGSGQVLMSGDRISKIEISASEIRILDPQQVDLPPVIKRADTRMHMVEEPVYQYIMYLSLALIISGVGFLKANISTLVGSLYGIGDRRRDSGFTIFYMGINIGAFMASLLCGYLGIVYGWKYGFGLAGIGMALGLVIFLLGQPLLQGRAEPPHPEKLKERVWLFLDREMLCYLGGLGMIAVSMLLVIYNGVIGNVLPWIGGGMLLFLIGYAVIGLEKQERDRMLVAVYVILAQIPFVALNEQAGSSLNLFTDRLVDRTVAGWTIPAPMFQSLNSGFIFLFAPVLAWLWIKLGKINREPSMPVKLSLSVIGIGLGFLTLTAGMRLSGPDGLTPVVFIVLVYWISTIGELLLVPVSLSAMTKLSPVKLGGMMMGAWFLYSGMATYVAGMVASTTGAETIGGDIVDIVAAKANYAAVYNHVALLAIAIGLVMFVISPFLKKMMHGTT
ncbi:peptide MFS transporter [Govanella unica]|uniref:Peptide MFS transporter n=1 Tax=Govanella unica TaxID=2975056 RepID=A0A9X3TXF3_9PROT|nr:peptide MFS transporter [Govania unica]MDA5193467.1 peptide MFS transporter [Govania unica]